MVYTDGYVSVVKVWMKTQSLKETAKITGVTYPKVRRILIDNGITPTERSQQIKDLRDSGVSREDIAEVLGVTPKTVDAHSPYRRKPYTGDSIVTKWRTKKKNEESVQSGQKEDNCPI